jgi:hypothetical protein
VLPKNVDKDPTFRANAIYTRAELEQLISDERILEDRRVLHALKGLAGLRQGEAGRLRWRHYVTDLDPLGALAKNCDPSGIRKATRIGEDRRGSVVLDGDSGTGTGHAEPRGGGV